MLKFNVWFSFAKLLAALLVCARRIEKARTRSATNSNDSVNPQTSRTARTHRPKTHIDTKYLGSGESRVAESSGG